MDNFKKYLESKKLKGRSIITIPSCIVSLMKTLEFKDFKEFIKHRDKVKELLQGDRFSPSSTNTYAQAVKYLIRFIEPEDKDTVKFYSSIGAKAMAAHKSLLNPNRQVRPRGVRANEAIKHFEETVDMIKQNQEKGKTIYTEFNPKMKLIPRINIHQSAIPSQHLDLFTRIDELTKVMKANNGQDIQDSTKELYNGIIKRFIERYNYDRGFKGKADLNFVVHDIDKVIAWLDKQPIHSRKQYESVIIKYLPLTSVSDDEKHKAYERYTAWLKNQDPNPGRYKEFYGEDLTTGKKNVKYTWPLLVKNVDHIIKHLNPTPIQKMFMLLFTRVPPRRSKDYSLMVISDKDDGITNTYNPKTHQFHFNQYKNSPKSGPQTNDIESKELINSLNNFVSKNPNNKYLFEKNGRALLKDDIQKILRDNIGKRFGIPFGVNAVRHLFATYIFKNKSPQQIERIARQMGTSSKMLNLHYIDIKDNPDEFDEEENVIDLTQDDDVPDLSKMFMTKQEQKAEKQREVRKTEKGKIQMKADNAKRKEAKNEWQRNRRAALKAQQA